MGLDPGTRVAGYGVVDTAGSRRHVYVDCGLLKAAGDDHAARIHEICQGLAELLGEFRPAAVAMECAYQGVNAQSGLKLAEARGALRLICQQHGVPVSEYQPSTIKATVVGRAKATKAEVAGRVAMVFGLQREPASDAADGLAAALCHADRAHGLAVWRGGAR